MSIFNGCVEKNLVLWYKIVSVGIGPAKATVWKGFRTVFVLYEEGVLEMANCYMCGVGLDDNNRTEEHIILNAIGGVLKSKNLICKQCNSNFGDEIDSRLAKQLQPISVLMNVERDRGKTPPIEAVRSSNNEKIFVYPGGKPGLLKPEVRSFENNGQKRYDVVARDNKEMNQIYKGIKKKHPSAIITDTGEEVENINEKITIEYDLGGKALESVCKTAIGYYLHIGGKQKHIQSFIDRFKKRDVMELCNFCYIEKISIDKSEDGIFHSIAIVGDSQQKILYSYIEFFNYYHVLVLLNDEYIGKNFRKVYCYNLIKKRECEAFFDVFVTREMVSDILSKALPDYGKLLVRNLQSTVRQIEIKNSIDKVWKEIVLEYQGKYPDGIPTEIFVKIFADKMVREFTPYLKCPIKKRGKL